VITNTLGIGSGIYIGGSSGGGGINYEAEMATAAEAYLTRISASNATYEQAIYDWAKELGDPRLYPLIQNTLIYPCWPESEVQAIIPFFPISGTKIASDNMYGYNSPTFSSSLGFESNGVDSCWYPPIWPTYFPNIGASIAYYWWYEYCTRKSTVTAKGGFQVNASNRTYRSGDNILASRLSLTSCPMELGANLFTLQAEDADYNPANDSFGGKMYVGGDYDTLLDSGTGTIPSGFGSANRIFGIGAVSTTSTDPEAPVMSQFSNQAISMFSFTRGGWKPVAKVYGEACDALQSTFGR